MRRFALCFLSAVLTGCEERPPLAVLEWNLPPGGAGFVEAAFVTTRAVFREPLDVNKVEIGSVVVSDVATGRWMIDWSGTGLDGSTVRRDVEVLSDRRFRLTTEIVPTDFPPAPYLLQIGVRGGDGPYLGWPTFIGSAEFGRVE